MDALVVIIIWYLSSSIIYRGKERKGKREEGEELEYSIVLRYRERMSGLTRHRTAGSVSRDQILRRGQ